ncbi:outer membrane beta-barrel protein [Robertkochia flava]|uniref:outer membrane beta-barrel protein n=1 Tax=Robertkochia flava TaxID=3447986 RepID=UPI001CCFFE72|nr:outer membrane beta-barrel protein [Robertkochia marina]
MKIRDLIFLIAIALISNNILAQDEYSAINYSVGIPASGMSDYIGKVSWLGTSLEYRKEVSSKLYVGFDIGFNSFYEDLDYGTFTQGTASITGNQNRSLFSMPILVGANYFFAVNEKFEPFVGFGLGTIYTGRETEFGIFADRTTTWFFAIRPEVGFMYRLNSSNGIKLAYKYNKTFDTKDLDEHSYMAIDLGWVYFF